MDYIMNRVKGLEPLKMAVICPTKENSLKGAFDAANEGIISPILIGSKELIEQTAASCGIDISNFQIINAENDADAAQKGVDLVIEGKAEALMKGSISTGKFMKPIVSRESGLRTDRRMSHAFILDDPEYHKPLYVSDAAVNHNQDLKNKIDITENVVDLFNAIEGKRPKVAFLSATEKVVESIPSSVEAYELMKLVEKGKIEGVKASHGPLAFDVAISKRAADIKGLKSEVAGDPDILIAANLDQGNGLYKSRTEMSGAKRGGIVLGAKIPVVLTSRMADSDTRKTSAALALLYVRKGPQPS